MSKLTREQKIEIYNKRKQEKSIAFLSKEYTILENHVRYLVNLIDKHGKGILRKDKNNYDSPAFKEEIINNVRLNHQSVIQHRSSMDCHQMVFYVSGLNHIKRMDMLR